MFWDVESTSKVPTEDHIISIGAVLATYSRASFHRVSSFHTYIRTKRAIDPAAFAVHGISADMLHGAPALATGIHRLTEWVQETVGSGRVVLMAHNGRGFDDVILFCNLYRGGLCFDTFLADINCYGFLDTLPLLRGVLRKCAVYPAPCNPATKRVSFALGHCYTSYCGGTLLEGAHDALVDSTALVDIFCSPAVSSRINMSVLFRATEVREKAVARIRQSAGMAFAGTLGADSARPPPAVQHSPGFRMIGDAGLGLCTSCIIFAHPELHQHSTV
jgi:DNA polymerase III epsilon subunit-like protein